MPTSSFSSSCNASTIYILVCISPSSILQVLYKFQILARISNPDLADVPWLSEFNSKVTHLLFCLWFEELLQGLLLFILRMTVMLQMLYVDLTIYLLVMTGEGFQWSGLGYMVFFFCGSFFFFLIFILCCIFSCSSCWYIAVSSWDWFHPMLISWIC